MIGETIGNFRITGKLGAGGMGEVFLAEQRNIETKVAIKMLRPEISADRQHVDRFFNEARAVSRIKHAGTVKIFDVGFHSTGHAYLVMEFLEGEALSTRIARGVLPLAQLCDVGRQASGVLEATHAAGITHRDLKPDNIFIVPDAELASGERVKILDFGIAKLSGSTAAGGPRTVGTMGTPAYMAPEQWGNAAAVDWRADVYSLGCVLLEMATGRPPFVATTFAEACGAHLGQPPPKLRALAPHWPEPLEALIDAMLAKSPDARPALREIANRLGSMASMPMPVVPAPVVATPSQLAATVAPDAPTHAPVVHQPTPVDKQTPRHSQPVRPVAPTVPVAPSQTTLSSATGSTEPPVARRSRAPVFAIGGLVAVGGIAAAVVLAGRDDESKRPVVVAIDAAQATPPDAAPVIADAGPPDAAVATWEKPTFVTEDGASVMMKQVTRAEYKAYLDTLTGAAKTKATPLKDWSDARAHEPVAWVTFEQATAFCAAVGGELPPSRLWLNLAKGTWHLRTRTAAEIIYREWTSTVTPDGLALVLGGSTTMASDAKRMEAVTKPMSKPTEASAGPNPAPEVVASAAIGIRCVRDVSDAALRGCDEVSCVLDNYNGACCAKYRSKKPLEAPPPSRPPPTTGPKCDEVACMLHNYEGPCCAKYKKK